MDNDIDVMEQLRIKNHELYINKLIIDLENTMESLLLFYSKKIDDTDKKELTYCDSVACEVINRINLFLDNQNDDSHQKVMVLVNKFFDMFKQKVNSIIPLRLDRIKSDIQNIDTNNYTKTLNNEALIIINQITDYYNESIYMLIDELSQDITKNSLDFRDYLLNNVHHKLINTLRDKLIYSVKLINNNYDENTMMLKVINQKTLK